MTDKQQKPEIVFAPGCFDNFDGTQEELDELIASIHQMVDSGEIFEKARPIDLDNPSDEDMDIIEHLMGIDADAVERKLQ
jgi:Mg2+ and Co2+ transporter CorA